MSEPRRAIAVAVIVAAACATAYRLAPSPWSAAAAASSDDVEQAAAAALERTVPADATRVRVPTEGLAAPLGESLRVTSAYGLRRNPLSGRRQFHAGVDLAAPAGTPVLAAAAGTVAAAGWYPREWSSSWWAHGRLVVLEHDDGAVSLYAHLSRVEVLPGTFVARGEPLGLTGSSGATTGPHLHFEIRLPTADGSLWPADPLLYLGSSPAPTGAAPGAPSGPQIPGGGAQIDGGGR